MTWASIGWRQFRWLADHGAKIGALIDLDLKTIRGTVGADGRFDEDVTGEMFLVIEEADDFIFWQPRSGQIGRWRGRAFAMNETAVIAASTYAFDNHLKVHADPLAWMRDNCDGIVVVDWTQAFDRLRYAPRSAGADLQRLGKLTGFDAAIKRRRGDRRLPAADDLAGHVGRYQFVIALHR
jgi:hypothetical protein